MGWGDELMATGHVRELQRTDPRRVRMVTPKGRWHEAWDGNPRIARPEERGDFQLYETRPGNLRPYCVGKDEKRWQWRRYGPPAGELYFDPAELAFGAAHAGRVIIEPNIKAGASPNKEWGWLRWKQLVLLCAANGVQVTQLGPSNTRLLPGADLVVTHSMRRAAAVMKHARAAVLTEGGLHHVAAAVGTPAVVIFGGFIAPEVTGYPWQVNLYTGTGLGCGARLLCSHCEACMAAIDPARVWAALERILREPRAA